MSHHPAPPDVLRAYPIATPKLEHDERASYLLVGKQFKMRQFLSGPDPQSNGFISNELSSPLAGPAHDGNKPLTGPLDIEIGPISIGWAAPRRGNALRNAGFERRFQGSVV